MIKNKRKKQWLTAFAVSAIALCSVIAVEYLISADAVKDNGQNPLDEYAEDSNQEWDWQNGNNYAFETVYAGDPYMPESLYIYSFDNGGFYRSNREIAQDISSDELASILQKISDFWTNLFNLQYKAEQFNDQLEKLQNQLHPSALIGMDSQYEAGGNDIITAIANEVISKHVSLEGEFITDKSLIYSREDIPGSYVVRGILHFTVIEADNLDMLQEYFGINDIELGREYSYMIETEIMQGIDLFDIADERITDFSIIAEKGSK